jgi:hypothetical protein
MFFTVCALALLAVTQTPPPEPEPCAAVLPAAVQELATRVYPGYRLVRASDYSPDDIASELPYRHGNACIGAASAAVSASSVRAVAFFLTGASGQTVLVAALPDARSSWHLHTLMDFGTEGPGNSFVNTLEPGVYADLYSKPNGPGEFTAEPGRVRSYRARRAGFVAGTIESSSIAFFYTGRRWVHLWLSD